MNIELTEEQKSIITAEWNSRPDNPPSLLELIKLAFPDKNVDGRSKEGRAVKAFLASRNLRARGAHEYQVKEQIDLSDEDKEFIKNNLQTMKANEMSRYIFKNERLGPLSKETRTVNDYIKTLEPEEEQQPYQETGEIPSNEYKPPTTPNLAISKINKYVLNGVNKEKISGQRKAEINSLIEYLNTYRFVHQINSYSAQTDRDLFESSFIRYTNDKHDLSQEEVDQYIVLSCEVVIASNIQRRVERLQQLLDNAAEDTEGRRIAMALVESISSAQTEYNQSVNRQHKLLGDLKEKRSDKLKSQIKENASILNLVQAWRDEESRNKMIKLAELRKKSINEEVEKLSSIDEFKGKIMGLTKDEASNG
tara:strand:+ start:4657 stop:5751 length:1095 start_codon:yes stop_codon:yes gene_type:complete